MKVFVSWAGDESLAIAKAVHDTLQKMLQGLDLFISPEIRGGGRWRNDLATALASSNYGILCLTPTALSSEWLLFEAGALTKLPDGKACGLLHRLSVTDIREPLSQFQHKKLERQPFLELARELNDLQEKSIAAQQLVELVDVFWPTLEERLKKVQPDKPLSPVQSRQTPEVLEELVLRVRNMERFVVRGDPIMPAGASRFPLRPMMHDLLKRLFGAERASRPALLNDNAGVSVALVSGGFIDAEGNPTVHGMEALALEEFRNAKQATGS